MKWGRESFLNNDELLEESGAVEDLEAALEQFREIAADLSAENPSLTRLNHDERMGRLKG